jgi:DNA-binding PadR family transcriptional regulator
MEENGYIEVYKDFFNKKPRTRYNLTVKGKDEFINYVNTLEKIIKQYQSSMGMVQ